MPAIVSNAWSLVRLFEQGDVGDRGTVGDARKMEQRTRCCSGNAVEKCLGVVNPPDLACKALEKDRSFLTHLSFSMIFPALVPLLKGWHPTLDQWRLGREEDGWAWSAKDH
jgi:hypothetical protein